MKYFLAAPLTLGVLVIIAGLVYLMILVENKITKLCEKHHRVKTILSAIGRVGNKILNIVMPIVIITIVLASFYTMALTFLEKF